MAIPAQTIYSLFSGIGGLDESVRLAAPGSKTLCYVEQEAFNCECERHDLLARKMQGHDICFATANFHQGDRMLPPCFMAAMGSEGDGVIYAVAVVASCTGEAKT